MDYKHTLESKMQQEELHVYLTCLDGQRRTKCLNEQLFTNIQNWEEWKKVDGNDKKLEALFKSHGQKEGIEDLTREEFFALLEADEQRALHETFAMATEVQELDTYVPLHFWLIDSMSAIFAIPSSSAIEYGFSTTDHKLISAFIDLRRRYHKIGDVQVHAPAGEKQ